MTLTLVPKKRSYHKEYTCEILKLYYLPHKRYGKCSIFLSTNRATNRKEEQAEDKKRKRGADRLGKKYMPIFPIPLPPKKIY